MPLSLCCACLKDELMFYGIRQVYNYLLNRYIGTKYKIGKFKLIHNFLLIKLPSTKLIYTASNINFSQMTCKIGREHGIRYT